MLNAVSNFYSTLPDCCKRSNAVFSPLHRLDIPLQGKCAAWPSFWTCLFPVSGFLCASNSDHRFRFNLLLRRTAILCASRSRFALSTVSVPFSPLHSFALVTQRPLIRSFVRSKTDRPSRTSGICRLQNCRSPSAASPLSTTISLRLPLFDAVYPLRNQICRARPPRTPRHCCPLAAAA